MATVEVTRPTAQPLETILSYENARLYERFVADHGGSLADARARFTALKQFLTVCAVLPGIKVASDEIDQTYVPPVHARVSGLLQRSARSLHRARAI